MRRLPGRRGRQAAGPAAAAAVVVVAGGGWRRARRSAPPAPTPSAGCGSPPGARCPSPAPDRLSPRSGHSLAAAYLCNNIMHGGSNVITVPAHKARTWALDKSSSSTPSSASCHRVFFVGSQWHCFSVVEAETLGKMSATLSLYSCLFQTSVGRYLGRGSGRAMLQETSPCRENESVVLGQSHQRTQENGR